MTTVPASTAPSAGAPGSPIGGSVSSEPDYLSYGIGASIAQDFDEKNTTLTAGYGYGHDIAGRSSTPFSVFSRVIEHGTFNVGLTQVINRSTVGSLSADLVLDNGDQSKPYRYIPMFNASVAANVPLGASIADGLSKPKNISGMDFGDPKVALTFAAAIVVLVAWLAVTMVAIVRDSAKADG